MKKKITLFLTLVFVLFLLVSCGNTNNDNNNSDTPNTGDTPNPDKPAEYTGYQVKVLYPDGTAANSSTKIKVKVCTVLACQYPIAIDDNGVAKLEDLADDTYFVHLQNVPQGYTYNPNLTIKPEAKQLELKLIKLTTPLSGEGTQASPYVMENNSTYTITCSKAKEWVYFTFTPAESGSYMIESLVQSVQSESVLVPAVYYVEKGEQSEFGNNKNINYSINVEAGKTYTLAFTLLDNTVFPAGETVSYNFSVSKLV